MLILGKCKHSRKQFSITVGAAFEKSNIPVNKWLMAVHLMCASKKASSHRIHRMLGVIYKSAWFMTHRIREAMKAEGAGLMEQPSFSLLKRGLFGTFHHVGEQHQRRYVTEFDFRGNTRSRMGYPDAERQ